MDSVKLKELEQARRRVVEGEKTLSRQREVVANGELAALKRLLRSGGVPTPLPSSFHAFPGLPPKQLFQSFNG